MPSAFLKIPEVARMKIWMVRSPPLNNLQLEINQIVNEKQMGDVEEVAHKIWCLTRSKW